jgi:hypothetical protein
MECKNCIAAVKSMLLLLHQKNGEKKHFLQGLKQLVMLTASVKG